MRHPEVPNRNRREDQDERNGKEHEAAEHEAHHRDVAGKEPHRRGRAAEPPGDREIGGAVRQPDDDERDEPGNRGRPRRPACAEGKACRRRGEQAAERQPAEDRLLERQWDAHDW